MEKNPFRKNLFLYLFFLFLAAGFVAILSFKKGELTLYINGNISSGLLDVFFVYFTYLGDGILIIPFFVAFLFVKYKYAIMVALSGLFQLTLVHVAKRFLFPGALRPKLYLEGHDLHFIEGLKVHGHNSFPSGHTTTAFALFFLLSLFFSRSKPAQVVLFLAALFVGISRVYLLQHFFIDVYFGSILGITSSLLAYWLTQKYFNSTALNNKLRFTSTQ